MCKRRTRFDLNEIHHRRGMCSTETNETKSKMVVLKNETRARAAGVEKE